MGKRTYKRNCNKCGKYYEGRGEQYCSRKCCSSIVSPFVEGHKKGFEKGYTPWNKNQKTNLIPWNKGFKRNKKSSKGYETKVCKNCKKEFSRLWKKEQSFCSNKCAKSMENNASWLGGISFEPYGLEFNNDLKEQIRTRDNHACQECGYTQDLLGYKLHIHHIDYTKQNNNPNNLISLCRNCHMQTNFNRNDWTNYYNKKVIELAPQA